MELVAKIMSLYYMPNGVKCQRDKKQKPKAHVGVARGPAPRLDVGDDKGLMYQYGIEALNSDGDVLKQECCLARIAGSGRPTSLGNSRDPAAIAPRVSSAIGTKSKLWGRQEYLASFRATASSAAPAAE